MQTTWMRVRAWCRQHGVTFAIAATIAVLPTLYVGPILGLILCAIASSIELSLSTSNWIGTGCTFVVSTALLLELFDVVRKRVRGSRGTRPPAPCA